MALELSVLGTPSDASGPLPTALRGFELPVSLQSFAWAVAWEELAKIGLYRYGPDVSQVGTTWLDGLANTGALRPFSEREIDEMGGASAFVPALWDTVSVPEAKGIWAIPWLADVRVIFYWRDMLEEAGVDEKTAYKTPEHVEKTMQRLQASQLKTPWSLWTLGPLVTLHNATSWMWQSGGNFVSRNGKQATFHEPKALAGLIAFLALHRYRPPGFQRRSDIDAYSMFLNRQVVSVMAPCGWINLFENHWRDDPDTLARLGVARPPGPAFVGGSLLVVWEHTHRPQDAVALVRFLTSKQAQLEFGHYVSLWPSRLETLAEPPYATDPRYQIMGEALKTGRSYPTVSKWGIVEDKLSNAITWLWDSMLEDPNQDLEALTKSYLGSLAQRLTVTLGGRT